MSGWLVPPLFAATLAMVLASSACSSTSASSRTGIAPAKASPTGATGSEISGVLGSCRLQEGGRLPDPACSPGGLNPDITPDPALLSRTICKRGWIASVRPKNSDVLKHQVLLRYGISPTRLNLARYAMDHRVPLEVGGAPHDLANLWPEPWEADRQHPDGIAAPGSGAQSKDKIENRTRAAICNGQLSLQQGQQLFLGDWWQA
jgi:hypothetical protein